VTDRPIRRPFICAACWPYHLHELCDVLRGCECGAWLGGDGALHLCAALLPPEDP
jgi:hypothetical protein